MARAVQRRNRSARAVRTAVPVDPAAELRPPGRIREVAPAVILLLHLRVVVAVIRPADSLPKRASERARRIRARCVTGRGGFRVYRCTAHPVALRNDHEIIDLKNRVLRGDREAAERLFKEVFDPLYEFTYYRVGGDRTLAETVVQDTITTAFEKLASFEGRSTFHSWLCGIAKNKIRSFRRARRPRSMDQILEESEYEIDAILAKVETEPLPEEVLERAETRELVGATLSSLPPNYREVLIAKYVDDLQVDEIAARAGRGFKATESVLQRARVAFAKVFELLAKKRGDLP